MNWVSGGVGGLEQVGSSRQLARAELLEFADGSARGSRLVRLTSGGGFDVEVFPDRAMDLGAVSWRGTPLAWLSAVGPSVPTTPDAFLRGFGGGLLTTCGLDQFGAAAQDGDVALPMHGTVHALAASDVRVWSHPVVGTWEIGAAGRVRQSSVFGENLRLDRRITTSLGSPELRIEDTVSNDGPTDWPFMVLYHLNLGWPVVDAHSSITITHERSGMPVDWPGKVVARDAAGRDGEGWSTILPPTPGYGEQVFLHALPPDADTVVRVASPSAGLAVEIRFPTSALPHLYQWKALGPHQYVLGIEPANAIGIHGRAEARANGTLQFLQPGQQRTTSLTVAVSELERA